MDGLIVSNVGVRLWAVVQDDQVVYRLIDQHPSRSSPGVRTFDELDEARKFTFMVILGYKRAAEINARNKRDR